MRHPDSRHPVSPHAPPLVGATARLRQSFTVPYAYDVLFTSHAFEADNPVVADAVSAREPAKRHRVLVVLDEGVVSSWPELPGAVAAYFENHSERLQLAGDPVVVAGGETAKNDPALVSTLHAEFHRRHLDRHSFVLIVGGGGVLDAVGFAAATAHRGLRVLRMPTTVLGQNDSGVGVKNGVNAFGAKNFVGTFAPPFAVINDFAFIDRLAKRDKIAGIAEAVKVALIRDLEFFSWLESNGAALAACEAAAMAPMIQRCATLHLQHIATSGDPFEQGSARPLDFGHWAAHRLESMTAHELRHGEAVAIGVLLDSRYSVEAGFLPEIEFGRIHRLFRTLGLPRWHEAIERRTSDGRLDLILGLDDFREHLGGELTVTLLSRIGQGFETSEIRTDLVERALTWMRHGHP